MAGGSKLVSAQENQPACGCALVRCLTAIGRCTRRCFAVLLLLAIPIALHGYSTLGTFRFGSSLDSSPVSQSAGYKTIAQNHSAVLLVSAYFPLTKSKHSHHQYKKWISEFLAHITTDVYVFIPEDTMSTILHLRGRLPIHVNTSYGSAFDIPPFEGLRPAFDRLQTIDSHAYKHTPELYAIWSAKPFFVAEAARNARLVTGKEYDYVFWLDVGTMREQHAYRSWPDIARLRSAFQAGAARAGAAPDDLLFVPLSYGIPGRYHNWTESDGPIDPGWNFSEGSFFGGSPRAIEWWCAVYTAYFSHWLSRGLFVGDDQELTNALVMLYPERIVTVWNRDPTAPDAADQNRERDGLLGFCGDPWSYYFFWLASDAERSSMNDMWQARLSWRKMMPWNWYGQQPTPEPCRNTRVLGMSDVLEHAFAHGWTHPSPTVIINGSTAV